MTVFLFCPAKKEILTNLLLWIHVLFPLPKKSKNR